MGKSDLLLIANTSNLNWEMRSIFIAIKTARKSRINFLSRKIQSKFFMAGKAKWNSWKHFYDVNPKWRS